MDEIYDSMGYSQQEGEFAFFVEGLLFFATSKEEAAEYADVPIGEVQSESEFHSVG